MRSTWLWFSPNSKIIYNRVWMHPMLKLRLVMMMYNIGSAASKREKDFPLANLNESWDWKQIKLRTCLSDLPHGRLCLKLAGQRAPQLAAVQIEPRAAMFSTSFKNTHPQRNPTHFEQVHRCAGKIMLLQQLRLSVTMNSAALPLQRVCRTWVQEPFLGTANCFDIRRHIVRRQWHIPGLTMCISKSATRLTLQ